MTMRFAAARPTGAGSGAMRRVPGLVPGLIILAAASLPLPGWPEAGPTAARAAASPTLLHDLDRTARVSDPQLSPDGRRVAFAVNDSLDPSLVQVWLVEARGGVRPRPFTAGGRSAWNPRWSPDGGSLLFLSTRSDTSQPQVQWIDMEGGESRPVTGEAQGVADMAWSPAGGRIAYVVPGGPGETADPIDASARPPGSRLRVREMEEGATRTVSPDSANVWRFAWAPDGRRLAVLFTRPGSFGEWRRGMLALVDADGGNWRRIPGRWDPTQELAWSPDGTRLAAFALPAADYAYPVLHLLDPERPDSPRRLSPYDLPETDLGVAWSDSGGLVTDTAVGVRSFLVRIDPATGARTRLAERWAGGGGDFTLSRNGTLAWIGAGADHPGDVYLRDAAGGEPRRLSFANPQLAGRDWAVPRPATWTSFDGRRVEGVLIEPGSEFPRPVPLVVIPHGGPSVHTTLGFFGDAHEPGLLLASRGYAVLYPNPRGSTGYGEEFNALNRGDLGGGDFRDIDAGVDSLVAAGLADPDRLGIAGWSYGGYMTAWTVAHTDRYRCAIVSAGPMNYLSDYAQNDLTPYWQREFLKASPWDNPEVYLDRSPIRHVRRIRTPVLIVHGADDIRVPVSQSRELFAALRELGVPVEFRIYPREGHGVEEPAHRIDFMERQLAWFETHFRRR